MQKIKRKGKGIKTRDKIMLRKKYVIFQIELT